MLISDTYKFIFIAIPKTGTHSVRNILKEYSTDEHVGNGGGVSIPHKSNFKEFAHLNHGHITLEEMSNIVDTSKYFTFCVFRNPYSRAVSLWSFWNRHLPVKPNIVEFFKNETIYNRILFKQQSYFITPQINYIIKFEEYQKGINHVLEKLGIRIKELQIINSSEHDDYEKYYSEYPELREIIREKYAKDLEIWEKL